MSVFDITNDDVLDRISEEVARDMLIEFLDNYCYVIQNSFTPTYESGCFKNASSLIANSVFGLCVCIPLDHTLVIHNYPEKEIPDYVKFIPTEVTRDDDYALMSPEYGYRFERVNKSNSPDSINIATIYCHPSIVLPCNNIFNIKVCPWNPIPMDHGEIIACDGRLYSDFMF